MGKMATALVVLAIGVVALLLVVAAASLWRFARRLPGTARGAAEQGAASVSNRGVVSPFYYGNTPAMPPVARASSGGAAAGKPRRPITSSDSNLISFRKRSSSSSKPTSPEGQASSSGLRRRNDLRIEQVDAADSQKRSPSSGLRSSPSTGQQRHHSSGDTGRPPSSGLRSSPSTGQERHHSSGDTGRSPSSATGTPPSTGLHGQSDSDKGRSSNTGQDRSPGDANTAGGRNGRAPHTVSTGSKAHAHVHSRVSVSGPPSSNKRIWVAHAQQAPVVSSRSLSESSGLQHILEVAESRYAVPEKPGAKRRDERTGGGGGRDGFADGFRDGFLRPEPFLLGCAAGRKVEEERAIFPGVTASVTACASSQHTQHTTGGCLFPLRFRRASRLP